MRWCVLALGVLQGCNGLFYHPDAYGYRQLGSMPGGEELVFASGDGTKLHAWFLPAQGFDVFAFDYRGYGKSEGSPSRQGLHEDSIAALEYVRSRDDVDPDRIVVLAQSLGGACATAALGESGLTVRGVALDSTFAHYISMGNEVLGGTFLTYPLAWLLLSNDHSPADAIANLAPTPILCVHSLDDPVVPIRQGRALYEAAGDPKEFVEVPARGHPIATTDNAARQRLLEFFTACLKK